MRIGSIYICSVNATVGFCPSCGCGGMEAVLGSTTFSKRSGPPANGVTCISAARFPALHQPNTAFDWTHEA